MPIDYEDLLRRYIALVVTCTEGFDFVRDVLPGGNFETRFSAEECEALKRLAWGDTSGGGA